MGQRHDSDEAVKTAFAAVYGASAHSRACGGGFLVGKDLVLTCAHVVNSALGRSQDDQSYPEDDDCDRLSVAFPYFGAERFPAVLYHWSPRQAAPADRPLRNGGQTWTGDLALLKVDGRFLPETARPVRLVDHVYGTTVLAWYGSGESTTVVAASVQAETGPWLAVDSTAGAKDLVAGYSGGPVWDRARRGVVGMVIGAEGRRGYAMPTREIMRHLYLAGVHKVHGDPDLTPAGRASLVQFRAEMENAFVRIEAYRNRLAVIDRMIEAALGLQRGIATLAAETGRRSPDLETRQRLAAAAVRVRPGELLGSVEYSDLMQLLDGAPVELLHAAIRRALPDLNRHPENAQDAAAVVEFLEKLFHRPGTVPSLLRVVEFVAAGHRAGDREGMWAWNDAVARRLGVPYGALQDRRSEAESWAAAPASRARIQIRLERVETGRFRHYAWVRQGKDFRMVGSDEEPRTAEGVVASIERILREEVLEGVEAVLVEFFVDLEDLDLEVDRWLIPGGVERMLGVEHEVVVRCLKPRLANAPKWRRRWGRLGAGEAVVLDGDVTSPQGAYAAITAHDDEIACVVAFPGAPDRAAIVSGCVYAGVPVILWARAAHSPAERAGLVGMTTRDRQPTLPTAVRKVRGQAVADPDHPGGRIGLVWDEPDAYPQELKLSLP